MPEKRKKIAPVRISAVEVIIICLVCLCGLLLVTNNFETFVRVLYSPVSFLVLVVVLAEYIVLKSADRSRLYRIEVDKLRDRLLDHMRTLEQLETTLDRLQKTLKPLEETASRPENRETLEKVQGEITRIRESIKALF